MKRKTCRLEDLAAKGRSIISGPFGSSIGSRFFQSDGVPVIRGNNLTTDHKKFVEKGFAFVSHEKAEELNAYALRDDILFTAAGTIGQVGIIPRNSRFEKYVISNKQLRIRVDPEKADPDFVFYWLASPWIFETIQNRNTGSTVPLINLGTIRGLPVVLPGDVEDQKKVSALLGAIDAKIELNQRINAELEGMAKLLYDYWFVQFDFPMTAAQAAALGKPKVAGHPYRASGGKMVWSQELKREVPEDWRVGNLGELCDIFDGPHATPTKTESGPYYLSISSLENGRLDLTKSARLSEAEFVKWTRRVTPTAGDVLFSYETRLGEAALMPAEIRACLGRRMGLLRPKRDQVSPAFLLQSYLSQAFQGVIRANVIQGATVERISLNDLPSFPMLIPALEQRDAASKILTPLHGKIAQNQRQTQELTALRDWLLPMLMNGQVTVG
jgi:type I restriction enzyme, S subunit